MFAHKTVKTGSGSLRKHTNSEILRRKFTLLGFIKYLP